MSSLAGMCYNGLGHLCACAYEERKSRFRLELRGRHSLKKFLRQNKAWQVKKGVQQGFVNYKVCRYGRRIKEESRSVIHLVITQCCSVSISKKWQSMHNT